MVNQRLEARRARGEPVLHLGFGEAGLPVLPELRHALAEAASCNRYGPVAGSFDARAAAAGYFTRRGLPTAPAQVVFAPGSKPLLYAVVASVPGPVILPQPSWVSYAAQAALAHKAVMWVPAAEAAGGVPDPEGLATALARWDGGPRPGLVVLTVPDNPTGTLAPRPLLEEVCGIAAVHGITVVSDEIYRDLCYRPEDFTSPAELLPDRCVVTTGLSKSMAVGGWRVGFARFPDSLDGERLRLEVVGVASEVWSCLAEPLQAAAAFVLDEPDDVVDHVAASRRLHQQVALAVRQELVRAGAHCRAPDAAFYVYPDFAPLRAGLERRGIATGPALAEHLLERYGLGVLEGSAFGDPRGALRFRAASSLLYGDGDEQRWEALRSEDPLALPWIAGSLGQLRAALRGLVDDIS